jgi:hypothetical protein
VAEKLPRTCITLTYNGKEKDVGLNGAMEPFSEALRFNENCLCRSAEAPKNGSHGD